MAFFFGGGGGVADLIQPELNHVNGTDLWPLSQNRTANKSSSTDFDDTLSSPAESVHVEIAS